MLLSIKFIRVVFIKLPNLRFYIILQSTLIISGLFISTASSLHAIVFAYLFFGFSNFIFCILTFVNKTGIIEICESGFPHEVHIILCSVVAIVASTMLFNFHLVDPIQNIFIKNIIEVSQRCSQAHIRLHCSHISQ